MQTDSNSPSPVASTNNNFHVRKLLIPRSQRRTFLLQFTLMTMLGWVVGGIASIALERIILENVPSAFAGVRAISSLVFAVVFAADQSLVLRRYFPGWQWVVATTAGWLIANGVATAWINYISAIAASLNDTPSPELVFIFGFLSTISYIISGIWLGIFQWLVLRRYTNKAWWWNFVPSISFLFISLLIWLLSVIQNFIPEVNRTPVLYWSQQGFTAIILGVVPAIGLCVLKRNSHHEKEGERGKGKG